MPLMTMACLHNHYALCTSKRCECTCHTRNTPSLVTVAREDAFNAVNAFVANPDDVAARHAIEALSTYRGVVAAW